eukprot:TRINITY_DN10490_c0_g1_i3.p2 TRINITY_DN10490_c0_g1~~TRINITY_DN10490_c0_g1_i3.p2  ORF type:complete len:207 (+),score=5.48 TRINITY_DN10490_c0_g1_i3:415-1035(+)
MPIFSGADEGNLIAGLIYVISGIFGQKMWEIELLHIQLKYFLYFFIVFSSLFCLAVSFQSIKKKTNTLIHSILFSSLFIYFLIGSLLFVCYFSQGLLQNECRFLLYIFGILISRNIHYIQISHISRTKYKQLSWSSLTIVLALIFFLIIFRILNLSSKYFEAQFISYLLIITLLVYIHMIQNLIFQMLKILKIEFFTIKKNKKVVS